MAVNGMGEIYPSHRLANRESDTPTSIRLYRTVFEKPNVFPGHYDLTCTLSGNLTSKPAFRRSIRKYIAAHLPHNFTYPGGELTRSLRPIHKIPHPWKSISEGVCTRQAPAMNR